MHNNNERLRGPPSSATILPHYPIPSNIQSTAARSIAGNQRATGSLQRLNTTVLPGSSISSSVNHRSNKLIIETSTILPLGAPFQTQPQPQHKPHLSFSSAIPSTSPQPNADCVSPAPPAPMISPTFYDNSPNGHQQQAQAEAYQRWVESYNQQNTQQQHIPFDLSQQPPPNGSSGYDLNRQNHVDGNQVVTEQFQFAPHYGSLSETSLAQYGDNSQGASTNAVLGTYQRVGQQQVSAQRPRTQYAQQHRPQSEAYNSYYPSETQGNSTYNSSNQSQSAVMYSGNTTTPVGRSNYASLASVTSTNSDANLLGFTSGNAGSSSSFPSTVSWTNDMHRPNMYPSTELPASTDNSLAHLATSRSNKATSSSPVSNRRIASSVSRASPSQRTSPYSRSQGQGHSRKRQRKGKSGTPDKETGHKAQKEKNPADIEGDSDTESEDEGEEDNESTTVMSGGISVGMGGLGVTGSNGGERMARLPGACSHCKKLKMKCDFPKKDNTCKRCRAGGHVCIVEGRKPRTAPNKREYLLAQIRQKDAIIESLLKQLHNPYSATPLSIASYRMAMSPSDENNKEIVGWLDRLQSSLHPPNSPTTGTKGPVIDPASFAPQGTRVTDRDMFDHSADRNSTRTTRRSHFSNEHRKLASEYGYEDNGPRRTDEGSDTEGSVQGEKLQSLPDENVPLGLIANLSLDDARTQGNGRLQGQAIEETEEEALDDDNVGVANKTYFLPGPATNLNLRATMIEEHSPPEILVHGLVSPKDVDKLFEIFYERLNPFVSLLDPVLHTPASTFARCPFLFTVVCAIASRYYAEKSEIYPIAMHFAKHAAANALIDGWKSVELCQAYILMSVYAVPARRWEEDRSWLYTGLAIRIATDLNLHQPAKSLPANERQERENLNRLRVWMICFNLDRSTATQFGKPSTIKEDFVMRNAKDWYKKSKYSHPYDIHLCGYTALLKIVARFHDQVFSDSDSPTGLNRRVDFRTVTLEHNGYLNAFYNEWNERFSETSDPQDKGSSFRCLLLPFLVEYSRLVMFSFGFQQAFQRGIRPGDEVFFTSCFQAAKAVITHMISSLAPSGYMRFAPDGHFVFAAFASAFLLKLLKPEFSGFLVKDQETEIFSLIGRLIQTLSSAEIAIDDRHTPKLYARFLAGLLSRHRRDGAAIVGRLHTQPGGTQRVDFQSQGSRPASASTSTFAITQQPQQNVYPIPTSNSASDVGDYSSFAIDASKQQWKTNTPVYKPEATFTFGAGPISFSEDLDLLSLGGGASASDEEMLATMQAVNNPAWWQTMMMPGFSWPDPASPMTASDGSGSIHSPLPHSNSQVPSARV